MPTVNASIAEQKNRLIAINEAITNNNNNCTNSKTRDAKLVCLTLANDLHRDMLATQRIIKGLEAKAEAETKAKAQTPGGMIRTRNNKKHQKNKKNKSRSYKNKQRKSIIC